MPPKSGTTTVAAKSNSPARRPPHRAITLEYVEALKAYAEVMFKGGMLPQQKNGPPARTETAAAIIEVGRDVGLPATQALANVMIVRGRPSMWGDAVMGLILSSGLLEYREEWYEGTPGEDDHTACYKVKRVGARQERVAKFSVADAKRANLWGKPGPWTEYPERQMMWRAKSWACRDEFPDVLCGLIFTEEALDIPAPSGRVEVVQTQPEPGAKAEPEPKPLPEFKPEVALEVSDEVRAVTTPATAPAPEPITKEQLDRLGELRHSMAVAANLSEDDDEQFAEIMFRWETLLKPFGVDRASKLTREQADTFIEQLGKTHDPFTHPPESPAG